MAKDAYKFRSLTLRQLKDARTFFHNGSFSDIREVVSYFNDGVAQDRQFAGQAGTLSPRFTNPRGDKAPRGLGLNDAQMDAIADFLENGLYDPGFAAAFQPNDADLVYSKNHPELSALGAKDGQLLSGRAIDNDDPLSRRDEGLESLDVTPQVRLDRVDSDRSGSKIEEVYRLNNVSDALPKVDPGAADERSEVTNLERGHATRVHREQAPVEIVVLGAGSLCASQFAWLAALDPEGHAA